MKANKKAKQKTAVAPVFGTLLVLPIIMLIITAMMTWAENLIDKLKDLQDSIRETTRIYNELSVNISHFKDMDIIWQDGYESDFNCSQWIIYKSDPYSNMSVGPGSGGEISYFSGTLGAEITTESGYVEIYKPFPTKNLGRVSIEFKFTIHQNERFKYINISQNETSNQGNNGSIKIDISNNRIEFLNGSSGYDEIANNVPLLKDTYGWHTFVLNIDLSKGEYISLVLNEVEYNLKGKGLENPLLDQSNVQVTRIYYTNQVSSSSVSYIDDFVFRDLEFFEKLGLE